MSRHASQIAETEFTWPDWPVPDPDVLVAIQRAFREGSWGRYYGPQGNELRDKLALMHGVSFVHPCSSGTIAVELALRGLRVGAGDEVIMSAYDFAGNFRCIEAVGAFPVLVDISPATWCIDIEQLEPALSSRTKAIIASHLHGGLVPMRRLREWADQNQVSIVEDACQATGAVVDGKSAGSWGDAGVLSFGGSKLVTAGRGGAVLTDDARVAQRIRVFADQGNDAFPLSELQAAVLLPQLDKLESRNQLRRQNVAALLKACDNQTTLKPIHISHADSPSFYKLAFLLTSENINRETFIAKAEDGGVNLDEGFRGFTRRSRSRCRKV